jgi:hypothetical protein
MKEINVRSCRKLFINCDGSVSCIAPFADDVSKEKCLKGIGECEFRINNATGKADPEGV